MKRASPFLLVGLLFLAAVPFIPTALAVTDLLEDFDDDTPPNLPTADWYTVSTAGTGGFRTTASQSVSAPNSYFMDDTTAGQQPSTTFDVTSSIDFCDGGSWSFRFRVDDLPDAGAQAIWRVLGGAANEYWEVIVQDTGVLRFDASGSGGAATANFVTPIVADTWYEIQGFVVCATSVASAYLVTADEFVQVDAAGAMSAMNDFIMRTNGAAPLSQGMFLDDLQYFDVDFTQVIAATESVAVTNLVGFDVNPLGTTAVARFGTGGDTVGTYDAVSLTAAATTFDTECNRVDGVMATYQGDHVAFIDCDAIADPTSLMVRTGSMSVPTFPGCDECDDVILLNGFSASGGDNTKEIGQLKDYPVDQSNNHPVLGFGRRQVAWGYSATGTSGIIGVNAFTRAEADVDERNFDEVQWSNIESPEDFCVGLDPESDYYVAAVGDQSSTKFYNADLTTDPLGSTANELQVALSDEPTILSSAFNNAIGVSCGQRLIVIAKTTTVAVVEFDGTLVATKTVASNTDARNVAISEVFNINTGSECTWGTANCVAFVAYRDGASVKVAWANNLTEVASLTPPAGTWHSMSMDRTAQNVWIATDDFINRYEIITTTTGDPVSPQGGVDPGDEGGPTSPLFDTSGLDGLLGSFGANLLFGVITIGLVGVGVGTGGGYALEQNQGGRLKWNWGAALGGAVLGFFLAWAFGFFTTGVVFGIVVMAAIVLGLRLWFGRGASSG